MSYSTSSDGFGPASETMARDWIHWGDNSTEGLPIDEMIGQICTRSSDSYATDSSSSATVYSCGVKTYNGVFPSITSGSFRSLLTVVGGGR